MNTAFTLGLGSGLWTMVLDSGLFAQIILAILVVFSIMSWMIIFWKWRSLTRVRNAHPSFLTQFRRGRGLTDRGTALAMYKGTPLFAMYEAGVRAVQEFTGSGPIAALPPDARSAIRDTLDRVGQEQIGELEQRVTFLATTANASPFLGLLGTVWGIIDAFASIGTAGSASLAVVAPGISAALVATVAGLAAAIPAVVGYNWSIARLRAIGQDCSNFALEFMAEMAREGVYEAPGVSRSL